MVDSLKQEEIYLDLRPGRDGGAKEADGFIQQDARQRLLGLLRESQISSVSPKAAQRPSNIIEDRRHDAVFVNARRGAGKTTFLVKVLGELEDGKTKAHNDKLLHSLGIIDPTLIETKQHIVVVVIDRIRAAVEKARRRAAQPAPDSYEAFQRSLSKLARGLAMLDGIGSESFYGREWGDPEFVLDQGLEDARAAVGFELEFHDFIHHACEVLDIHSFVLAIDDIDTWFERGWPVLEAVRKYLTSPRLQIVLSGDLELYSLLVRASQWKQMGKDFLAAEQWQGKERGVHGRMGSITRKIDELQDQYLIKVLKPERRIDLQPLLDFKKRLRLRLSDTKNGVVDAETFVERFSAEALALHAPADRRDVLDLLLRIPTRSALQIMLAAAEMVAEPGDGGHRKALDGLRYVAWTDLLNLQLSPGETQALAPRMLPALLARWFTEVGLWRNMPRFHPETIDAASGLPAIFGGALAVESFRRDPSQMLAYWLKISTIREMVDSNQVSEPDETAPDGRSLPRLVEHLNVRALESSLQTVSRLAAWELVLKRQVKPGVYFSVVSVPLERVRERDVAAWDLYGVLYKGGGKPGRALTKFVRDPDDILDLNTPRPLAEFHSRLRQAKWEFPERDGGFEGSFANGTTGLRSKVAGAAKLVVGLPALEIVSGQQKVQGGYSFLRLIATVAELLEAAGEDAVAPEDLEGHVRAVLSAASLLRSYPTPGTDLDEDADARPARGRNASAKSGDLDDDGADDEDPDGETGGADVNDLEGQRALVDAIVVWIKVWRGNIRPVAPLVLSRIWARFNYAHRSVRQRLKHLESRYLGVFMYRSLVAFLHAVLIESVRAAGGVASSNANNNPITAPEPFVFLLRDIDHPKDGVPGWKSEKLSLFEALFTCPLWAYFLPRQPDIVWKREPTANAQIFDAYQKRRSDHGLASVGEFATVRYRPDGGETVIEFEGLYDLLNTVQMQGNARKASRRTPKREGEAPSVEPTEG